jgi:sn-glycerol 3-phosphate transport system substrate-binding protein
LKDAKAELSTHDNQRVTKTLDDALQAILTSDVKPQTALDQAQQQATAILRRYQE